MKSRSRERNTYVRYVVISKQLRGQARVSPSQCFSFGRGNHLHLAISFLLFDTVMEVIEILLDISSLDNHLCPVLATLLEDIKGLFLGSQELARGLGDIGAIWESREAFAQNCSILKGHSSTTTVSECEIEQRRESYPEAKYGNVAWTASPSITNAPEG